MLAEAWLLASLNYGRQQVRSGLLLAAILTDRALLNRLQSSSPELAKIPGATLYLQASQDVRVGGRNSAALYQFHHNHNRLLMDTNADELHDIRVIVLLQNSSFGQKLPLLLIR